MKYNWMELKKKYMLGDYKSLKEFSQQEGINYSALKSAAKGWVEEKLRVKEEETEKIIEKTIEVIADREACRNARFLRLSDMALDAIEQYLKEGQYKKHVVKYKIYVEGRPEGEELVTETLDVPDTRAFINMITSLQKMQQGQRLAEGLNEQKHENEEGNLSALIDAINKSKKI